MNTKAFTSPQWTEGGETFRLVVHYDYDYQTSGSYCYDTEEDTKAAEDHEIAMLNSGEWTVYGWVREKMCPCCGAWDAEDSVWGYVTDESPEQFAAVIFGWEVQP